MAQLRCTAPTGVAAERITARAPGFSEATPAIAAAVARTADPWPQATALDTTGPAGATVGSAVRAVLATR